MLLNSTTPCAMLSCSNEYWLRDTLHQALKENRWFRVPTALLQEESYNAFTISVAFGGTMTFVPPTLALSCELLVQYENLSCDTVVLIDIDGIMVQVPCNESVIFPASVTSCVPHHNLATHVSVHILSPLPKSTTYVSNLKASVQVVIHEDLVNTNSCQEMVHVRHKAQTLATAEDNDLNRKALNPRLHHVRPNLPFALVSPPHATQGSVEPRKSLIFSAGSGLFATVAIPKGSFVTSYGGTLLHRSEWNEYKRRYPHLSHFGLSIMNGQGCDTYIIDGFMNYGTSLGRFANEPDHPYTSNVTTAWITTAGGKLGSTEYGYIAFVASRDILVNDEIYVKYGAGYVRDW
jgi:SET domain